MSSADTTLVANTIGTFNEQIAHMIIILSFKWFSTGSVMKLKDNRMFIPNRSGIYLIKFQAGGYKKMIDNTLNMGAHVGAYVDDPMMIDNQLYKIDAVQS